MKTNVYTIRDVVANESGPLFEAKNDGVAVRQFDRLVKDLDHKDEYVLLCVAAYDHEEDTVVGFSARVVEVTLDTELEDDDE